MDDELNREARELLVQIRRVRIGYAGRMTRILEGLGTNIPQYTALAILEEKGEITMGTLADALGITMGAVTNIVDRLVEGGWATRERGTDDRRVVWVKISEAGRQALEKAVSAGADYVATWLEGVSPAERRAFIDMYRRIAELIAATAAKARTNPARSA